MSPSLSVAVSTAPTFWPAAVFSATSRSAVDDENVGSLLVTTAATSKTAESPYMGRVLVSAVKLPHKGEWPEEEELGRPTVTVLSDEPSPYDSPLPPKSSVPLLWQPVKG